MTRVVWSQVREAPEGRAAGGEDGPQGLQQVEVRRDPGFRGGRAEDEDGAGEVSRETRSPSVRGRSLQQHPYYHQVAAQNEKTRLSLSPRVSLFTELNVGRARRQLSRGGAP